MNSITEALIRLLKNGRKGRRDFEDTVRRLLEGDFSDLRPEQREERVEQIIRAAAVASMAAGAAPVPLLELPIQAAMVGAIGRVHGVERAGKTALLEVMGALGGGLILRQALRFIPFVAAPTRLSRIYGTTWALGRAASRYYAGGARAEDQGLRDLFRETMDGKSAEQADRLNSGNLMEKLESLEEAKKSGGMGEEEYLKRRTSLLAPEPLQPKENP